MLLCDDTERDYGDLAVAEKFAASCAKMGLETVSMKNDFATIYGDQAVKVEQKLKNDQQETTEVQEQGEEQPADEELAPAA